MLAGITLLALAVVAQDSVDWSAQLKSATFTLRESIARGLKETGDGKPFHVELELDKGKLVYSVDVAQGAQTHNVVLDVTNGSVVEKELEDDDRSAQVGMLKISLGDAIDRALAKQPGNAIEAQLSTKSGSAIVNVHVFHDGRLDLVTVDGASGEAKLAAPAPAAATKETPYTDVFAVAADEWSSTGKNPFFVLEPGFFLVLEGKDEGKDARLTITVLDETKKVDGVETRVVEEREEVGGKIVEISRNFFAISKRSNSVYYFGEEVDMYKDGKLEKHEGAWLAGVAGARFGMLMPGSPLIGARYYQEIAPGVALDRAEVIAVSEAMDTPAGKFTGCLKTHESSALESGMEAKFYAPGIGLVREEDLKLVKFGPRAR